MTANAYHFDVQDEVDKLFADYPALAKRLIVAVVKVVGEDNFTIDNFDSSILAVSPEVKTDLGEHIYSCGRHSKKQGCSSAHSEKYGVNIIALLEPEAFHDKIPAEQLEHSKAFVLYHEAGHVLMKGGFGQSIKLLDVLYREHLADAFATIRMLQKFDDPHAVMKNISWYKAFDSVDKMTPTHMTTCMIDRILADSQDFNFRLLSADETLAMAKNYASVYMPEPEEVDQTIRLYREQSVRTLPPFEPKSLTPELRLKCVYAFANAALTANDNYCFYIGARLCAQALSEKTADVLDMPRNVQNNMRRQFIENARRRNLPVLAAHIDTKTVAKIPAFSIL